MKMVNAKAWIFVGKDDKWAYQIYCPDIIGLPKIAGKEMVPNNRYSWHVSLFGLMNAQGGSKCHPVNKDTRNDIFTSRDTSLI